MPTQSKLKLDTESHLDCNQTLIRSPQREVLYSDDLFIILGLDRLAHPDMALDRLIRRGSLPHRKIGGRLAFTWADVDRLIATGDRKTTRGRPPGSKNKPKSRLVISDGIQSVK